MSTNIPSHVVAIVISTAACFLLGLNAETIGDRFGTIKQPKKPLKIFAAPWPISSVFDLWCEPVIPSATTAESRDSIPASSAIVMAAGNNALIFYEWCYKYG